MHWGCPQVLGEGGTAEENGREGDGEEGKV